MNDERGGQRQNPYPEGQTKFDPSKQRPPIVPRREATMTGDRETHLGGMKSNQDRSDGKRR